MRQAQAVFGAPEAEVARSFASRVSGAVRLDSQAWDEIAGDPGGLGQALLVVLGAALAGGFAAAATISPAAAAESVAASVASWLLVSGALWASANGLGHRLGMAAALRVVGFAMAPLALLALAAIPVPSVQAIVRLVAQALLIAALVTGTRQALRVETMRAAFVCLLAALALALLVMSAVTLTVTIG